MANAKKISELTTAGPLQGPELVPVVQIGATLQTTVSAIAIFATSALSSDAAAVSVRLDQVSARVSVNSAAITSINNTVSALEVRVSAVSAAAVSINAVVSALDTRVGLVSAATSVNAAAITSINAVVSTKVNRFGDFMDNVQYIEFDTSTVVPTSVGRLSWSIEEGTLDIGFDNQGVVLHTGLQLYQRVYNDTAATLPKGAIVRITGSQGQRLTAALAIADSDTNSATTFAFMAEPVSVNRAGFAITEGVLKNVNTHAIPDGTVLWLSPVSAGVYTPTKPVAPQHLVPVGFVVKGNSAGAGSIYVKIINGLELGELHDVKVSSSTSLANGEVLAYDTSAGVWTNSTALINAQASISALNVQLAAVSALVSANAASITSTNNVVSALEIRVSAVSAAAGGNTAAITSINNVVSVLEIRVSTVSARASALDTRIAAVSASVSALQIQINAVSAALTSTNNVVSALEIRVSAASATGTTNAAAITSINNVVSALEIRVSAASATGVANAAAIVSTNNVVSALEIRVSAASATGVTNTAAITSINNVVSALEIRVSSVSAAVVSTNNVVSALEIRVSSVSAAVSTLNVRVAAVSASVSVLNVQMVQVLASISAINSVLATIDTAAITSINNVVSALEIRVSTVSARASALDVRLTTVSASVSVLQLQVNAVSAAVSAAFVSIGQRVLRAGDTMTGQLAIAVAANTIGVSVSGGLVVTSVVNFTGDSALLLQSGTTATRPVSPTPGQIRFNSGSNTFEGYTSATWGAIGGGGGATGGGTNQIFYLNDQVVSVSYSIPVGKNAGSFGPITVATGVTVEVPTSSVWTIV